VDGRSKASAVEPPTIPGVSDEDVLRATYTDFNARDIEAALERMHPEVDWPNAWEGGRVIGRDAVRDYWIRQFEQISGTVEPELFDRDPDGSITVTVHQVVHDAKTGELQADTHVLHRYRLEDGLIVRMDVLDAPT
jgi:ketosteroid isomerase-like protein